MAQHLIDETYDEPPDEGWTYGIRPQDPKDLDRGHYLCDVCGDAMTNDVVPAAQSPTGEDMAQCASCAMSEGA